MRVVWSRRVPTNKYLSGNLKALALGKAKFPLSFQASTSEAGIVEIRGLKGDIDSPVSDHDRPSDNDKPRLLVGGCTD